MRVLIAEYRKSLREARKMKRIVDSRIQSALDRKKSPSPQDIEDSKVIGSMISDLEFALEWMRSGRNPDLKRGIDKHGAYLIDQSILDSIKVDNLYKKVEHEITESEKEIIEDALCALTEKEKDVFMMIKVEGLTYEYTAELLGIKKTTVQNHLERALKKINRRKNESLFLVS